MPLLSDTLTAEALRFDIRWGWHAGGRWRRDHAPPGPAAPRHAHDLV